MKIKECCKDLNTTTCYLYTTPKKEDYDPNLEFGKVYIWAIPPNSWEEEGAYVDINYCPFCGKKIEVVE